MIYEISPKGDQYTIATRCCATMYACTQLSFKTEEHVYIFASDETNEDLI